MTRALTISLFVLFSLTGTVYAGQDDWFKQEPNPPLILAGDPAQTTNKPTDKTAKPASAKKDTEGENCQWACQRWGKNCTIDSRTGKYKCKRTCQKFGKICE